MSMHKACDPLYRGNDAVDYLITYYNLKKQQIDLLKLLIQNGFMLTLESHNIDSRRDLHDGTANTAIFSYQSYRIKGTIEIRF